MARVLTFSRHFPAYHPRKGQPTYFVEKLLKGFPKYTGNDYIALKSRPNEDLFSLLEISFESYRFVDPKLHTIRAGKRWKVGDRFSPRVWQGAPYKSQQITIAPDITIVKTYDIEVVIGEFGKEFYCNGEGLSGTSIRLLAQNDGLSGIDFFGWFNKSFEGQIICWDDSVNY